jgi:uncharacterized protein
MTATNRLLTVDAATLVPPSITDSAPNVVCTDCLARYTSCRHVRRLASSRQRIQLSGLRDFGSSAAAATIARREIRMTTGAPVSHDERVHTLDILRGLALLGMILVHLHQHMELDASGAESLIGWVTWVGVETKAWGVFALLFGAGFVLLLRNLERRGAPVAAFYLRRLAALAIFGLIAEAGFGFQILLEYAIWGVPLLLIRKWPSRALMIVAVLAVAVAPAVYAVSVLVRQAGPAPAAGQASPVARSNPLAALHAAEATGRYLPVLRVRFANMRAKYGSWTTYLPGSSFALFVIGVLAFRHGVFTHPRTQTRLISGAMAFGFTSWALTWIVYAYGLTVSSPTWRPALLSAFGLIQDQWLCLTYAGGVILLVAYRPLWESRLRLFGVAGRMALTNYLLQIAVLDVLASSYGARLRVRPLISVGLTAVLFGSLAMFSRWWLTRFRFGPAEWLWRAATYLRWPPMRRSADVRPMLPGTADSTAASGYR